MCFSASASFGVSAVLLTAGAVAIRKVNQPNQIPFAAIPLIFGIQQFTEGVLWLSLTSDDYAQWKHPFKYIFLIFAEVIWPVWVPLSIWLIEEKVKRKNILLVILILGSGLSLLLLYNLFSSEVRVVVSDYHISYRHTFQPTEIVKYISVIYFTATVIPALVSGVKRVIWVGGLILMSYIVTKVFFEEFVISVWCFFAALISIIILYAMRSFQKEDLNTNN